MRIERTPIAGLLMIHPKVFDDSRGFFFESYNAERFREFGLNLNWVQDNHARSVRNTVRGLHFQRGRGQAKLVRCIRGCVWDVAVDLRPDSATFGQWHGIELTEENKITYLVPPGFAHGYAVLSDVADVFYKCDLVYDPVLEDGIAWNDPLVGVQWPVTDPILSIRDTNAKNLEQCLEQQRRSL